MASGRSKLRRLRCAPTNESVRPRQAMLHVLLRWLSLAPQLHLSGLTAEEASACYLRSPGAAVLRRIREAQSLAHGLADAAPAPAAHGGSSPSRRHRPARLSKQRAIRRVGLIAPFMDKK